MSQITTRYSHAEVRSLITALVNGIAGRSSDPRIEALVRGIKLRAGMVALSLVAEAFIVKARGGTDEAGIKWKELDPRTIAYGRRLGPGDPQPVMASKRYGSRPYLTDDLDKKWRLLFATRKSWFMGKFGLSEADAGERAAASAWATVKLMGGKTKLEVLGGREVEIGRDTGRMLASLSPGIADPAGLALDAEPPPPPDPAEVGDRILRDDPGVVIIGTNVSYAGKFHATRPLWPYDGELPDVWKAEILEAVKSGIVEAIGILLAA